MSTVKADNFTWKTGEASGQAGSTVTGPQIVYGVAKSWVNLNGNLTGTFAARAGFNISSITRNAGGDYTITMANALIDINYSMAGAAGNGASGTQTGSVAMWNIDPTVTAFRIGCVYDGVTAYDNKWVTAMVQR